MESFRHIVPALITYWIDFKYAVLMIRNLNATFENHIRINSIKSTMKTTKQKRTKIYNKHFRGHLIIRNV